MRYIDKCRLSTEFACFVAGGIIQVIEAMPGSVVPLAMFFLFFQHFLTFLTFVNIFDFLTFSTFYYFCGIF